MITLIIWLVASIAALSLVVVAGNYQFGSESPKMKLHTWAFICLMVSIISSGDAYLTILRFVVVILYVAVIVISSRHAIKDDVVAWYDQHLKNRFKKS